MYNNQYSGYGSFPYPNYTNNFTQQYNGQQTPYNPPMIQQQNQQPQSNGNYYYVNGIEGAKAFLVPANSTIVLFDSDSNKLYIKSANQQGQATLKSFEYKEINSNNNIQDKKEVDMSNYITREEFDNFRSSITSSTNKEVTKNV